MSRKRRAGGGSQNPYSRADAKTRSAKAGGFPARSVHKLEEIDHRTKLLRPGQHVLDLGAAPGSWSMYASKRVGRTGRVLAIDLSEIPMHLGANVTVVQGNALELGGEVAAEAPFDVVISDMAPATSGNKEADRYRSYELCAAAIDMALAVLRPGGSFVGKIFMSDDFTQARDALREGFETVKTIRAEGTRTSSTEVFLVGLNRRSGDAEPG